jgi:hypothetical protein
MVTIKGKKWWLTVGTERMVSFLPENLASNAGHNCVSFNADEETIINHPIACKPRFKMTIQDAHEQGIIGNPKFTAILPTRTLTPGNTLEIKKACPSNYHGRLVCELAYSSTGDDFPLTLYLNPKARLHIIVN